MDLLVMCSNLHPNLSVVDVLMIEALVGKCAFGRPKNNCDDTLLSEVIVVLPTHETNAAEDAHIDTPELPRYTQNDAIGMYLSQSMGRTRTSNSTRRSSNTVTEYIHRFSTDASIQNVNQSNDETSDSNINEYMRHSEPSMLSPQVDASTIIEPSIHHSTSAESPEYDEFVQNNAGPTPALVRHFRNARIEQRLSFHAIGTAAAAARADKSDLTAWLKRNKNNGVSIISYSYRHRLALIRVISNYLAAPKPLNKGFNAFKYHTPGNILIVTSKANIEQWAELFRPIPHISILLYNESLAKRRKMGVLKVSSFNVTIVTFEILCSKEIVIPEDDFYTSEDEEKIASEYGDDMVDPWLPRRGGNEHVSLE